MFVRFAPRLGGTVAGLACLLAAAAAGAQTLDSSSASFNAGFGRAPGQENRAVAVTSYGVRDANGNTVIVDGVLQSAGASADSASSASASASASASGSFSGGVGTSSSTAIGNNLTVITQGNYNTVIVDSTQINNGTVTATTSANGKP